MHPTIKSLLVGVSIAILLVGFLWSLNLTIFNVWVSGGPPTPHPEIFAHRANIFGLITLAFLLALITLVLTVILKRRASRHRITPH